MKTLRVQMQIGEPDLASTVEKLLADLPGIEKIDPAKASELRKIGPDIIILDESARNGAVFNALLINRQEFPEAAIFLISSQHSPEHVVKTIKAGASEYFTLPLDPEQLRKSIEEVRSKSTKAAKQTRSASFGFVSSKGGLGATVLAVNTAVALAGLVKTVALCDLDLATGDSSVLLDLAPKASIADLSRKFNRLDTALLKNAMTPHASGVELLAAPPQPGGGEGIQAGQMKEIVEKLSMIYPKTVIDCPGFLSGPAAGALSCSEKIFIIIDLSVPAIRNAVKLRGELVKTGISEERIEYLVNRYVKNSIISVKEADKSLGRPVFWIFPNAYDEIFSSITSGVPAVVSNPRSVFGKNVRRFAEKLNQPDLHQDFRGISNLFGKPI